jgi:hypothetical protein
MAQANRQPLSRVSEVESSGMDLVRKEKRKGKRVGERDFAGLDFKPWLPEPDGHLVPSPGALELFGQSCRGLCSKIART